MARQLLIYLFLFCNTALLWAQADHMVVDVQPLETEAGQSVAGHPRVIVYEADGITGVDNIDISVRLVDSSAFETGTLTISTDINGVAEFSDLVIHQAASYALVFDADSATVENDTSVFFDVIPAAPDYMGIITEPLDTIQGYPIAGFPAVGLYDVYDNPIQDVWMHVSVNKNGFSAVSVDSALTDTNGLALFDSLLLDVDDTGYQLTFDADDIDAPGVANVTSAVFSVREEIAVLTVVNEPDTGIVNLPIPAHNVVSPVTVYLENMGGSPLSMVSISAQLNKNNFTGSSTVSATTNAQGYAYFDSLVIDVPDSAYQLFFSVASPNVAGAYSANFSIDTLVGNISLEQQPQNSVEGFSVRGYPEIYLESEGAPMVGVEVSVYVNQNSFAPGSVVTKISDAEGRIVFDSLILSDPDPDYQLFFQAEGSGIPVLASDSFEVEAEIAYIQIEQQAQTTIVGDQIIGFPSVTVRNALDASVLTPVTVHASVNQYFFNPVSDSVVSDVAGLVTFDNLVLDSVGTDYQLIFSTQSVGVGDVYSDFFNMVPVSGVMQIETEPEESVEGHPVKGFPTVVLYEMDTLTPIVGVDVTATLNTNDFTVQSVRTLTSDVNGRTVFDSLLVDVVGDSYTITFSVDPAEGIINKTTVPFDVKEETHIISMESQPTLSLPDDRVQGQPAVLITNKLTGDSIAGATVYVSLNKGSFAAGSVSTATTNSEGIAVFDSLKVLNADTDYRLIFSTQSTGIADRQSEPFDVLPLSGFISISSQPGESVEGRTVAGPPSIQVFELDSLTPVSGLEVIAVLNKNSFSAATVDTLITDANGRAIFDSLLIDSVADNYAVTFFVDPVEGIISQTSQNFDVKTEVAVFTMEEQAALTLSGERVNGPPTVKLLYKASGLPVVGANVYVSLNKGSFASVSDTVLTTDGAGIIVFDKLIIDSADTDYRLRFSTGASGIANLWSAPFDVQDPLGLMEISVQPTETVDSFAVAGPPTVLLTELNGDPWLGAELDVTVRINKNGFASGLLTKTTSDGTVVFDNLILDTIDNDYQLIFSVDIAHRIADRLSDSFDVIPATGYLSVSTQPEETVAGDVVNGPPTVRLLNLADNPVPGVTITAFLNQYDFTVGSTLTAVTNASGYAVFDNLLIDSFDTGYAIRFSAGASGVADRTTDFFEVTDASLDAIVQLQPDSTQAGTAIFPAPEVLITDGVGGIAGVDVTVSLNKNAFTPGSTLTATTDVNGVAVFDNLNILVADNDYTLFFNSDFSGVPNVLSDPFVVYHAAPSYLEVTSQPQETVAGNVIQGSPGAVLRDAYGNPVPGDSVLVVINQHSFASGIVKKETNANGEVSFDDLLVQVAESDYQLFFTAPSVTSGNSDFFAVTGGLADTIVVVTQPSETVAGAVIEGPPKVRVEDEFGNPVQGGEVIVSEVGGYAFDEGTMSILTDQNGTVSFTDLVISAGDASYQLLFSSAGKEQTSNIFQVLTGNSFSRYLGASHSGFISALDDDIRLKQMPDRIQIQRQPQETVLGVEVEGPPQLIVYDELDMPISDLSVSVSGPDFTAGTISMLTNSQGEISFSDLIIDSVATYTLTFTVDSFPLVTRESASFPVINPLASMTIAVQPQHTESGNAVEGVPTVELTNSIGMPMPGVEITVYTNQSEFEAGSVSQVITDMNGEAVFDQLFINQAGEDYQLLFNADYDGVVNVLSDAFHVTNAQADTVEIYTQPLETAEGSVVQGPPAVRVLDAYGNPVAGVQVTVSEILGGGIDEGFTQENTDTNGVAAFSTLVFDSLGTYQLSFLADGIVTPVLSQSFQVVSGTTINRFRGASHSGMIASARPQQRLAQMPARIEMIGEPTETVVGFVIESPGVRVYDEFDRPVANEQISVSLNAGAFSDGSTTRTTDLNGEILFNDLVIDAPGTYQLFFQADNFLASVPVTSSVSFEVTAQVYRMEIVTQPGDTEAGESLAGPPVVSLSNFIYQPLVGVEVTAYINQYGFNGNSKVSGISDVSGIVVFDSLFIDQLASGYQLIFDADYSGITNVTSSAFAVTSASVDSLVIHTQPSDVQSGSAISPAPAIFVRDAYGNPVSGFDVSVDETNGTVFDAGTLTATSDASGMAVFDDLILDTIGSFNLTFGGEGIADVVSNSFNVQPTTVVNRFKGNSHSGFVADEKPDLWLKQSPVRIDVVSQPRETVRGVEIEGPPSVVVYDEFDRPVPGVDIIVSGVPFTGGTLTRTTNQFGAIEFTDLTIFELNIYNLVFSGDPFDYPLLTPALSDDFEVVDQQLFLTVQTQPQTSQAGEFLQGPPIVRLANALNQGFPGVPVTVYLNQNDFSSSASTRTGVTDVSGFVVFDSLVVDKAASAYQLLFDADYSGVVNVSSAAFDVTSASASSFSIVAQPIDAQVGSAIAPAPSVLVQDSFGNPVSGFNVAVEETHGISFDAGTFDITSDISGMAAFDDLILDTMGLFSLNFSGVGVSDVTSVSFRVVSTTVLNRFRGESHSGFSEESDFDVKIGQRPDSMAISVQPQETVVGSSIVGSPRVVVYDEIGNPIGGKLVNVYITGDGAPVFAGGSIVSVVSDENGVALFDSLIVETTGQYNLTFELDAYDGFVDNVISQTFQVVYPQVQMNVTTQAAESVAGQVISGHPAVRLTTIALGQPFSGVEVTAYINQHDFAAGTQTVTTNAQGYAVFDDLVLNVAAANYQLIFDADFVGIPNSSSNNFEVVSAPASYMEVMTEPLNTQANAIIDGPPTIAVYDAFHNPVSGVLVNVSELGAYVMDAGTLSHVTAENGRVSFDDLMISIPDFYTFVFSTDAAGVADVNSQQFRILSPQLLGRYRGQTHSGFTADASENILLKQEPSYIQFLSLPQETVSGIPVEGPPTVVVYDQLMQTMENVVVTASVVGGTTPPLAGTVTLSTDINGEITFDNLLIEELGSHRLRFAVGGYPAVQVVSPDFEITAPVLQIQMHTQPLASVAGDELGGIPAVTITNALGIGVEGVTVSVSLNQHAFASDPVYASVQTNASGVAEFDSLVIERAASGYRMVFVAPGVGTISSASFVIHPASPDTMLLHVQPQTSEAGAAIAGAPTILLYDVYNNPVSGATVTVEEVGGEPVGGDLSVLTDASGMASFDNLTINNPGNYQLRFDQPDVDAVSSLSFTITAANIGGRFAGNTHSGFISTMIQEQPLMIPDSVEIPSFITPPAELCEGASHLFVAQADNNDSIRYAIAPAAFGSMNALTGELQLNLGFEGVVNVMVTAYGYLGPKHDTIQVSVLPLVDVPVFDEPVEDEICQGTESSQYTASIMVPGTIVYSALPDSAGTMNAATGLMEWDSAYTGNAVMYATASPLNGCGTNQTDSVEVVVKAEIALPVFTNGASALCQNAPNETYIATATAADTISYSLNDGTAGTLNPSTGVMNWAADFHGSVVITATATGCAGPKQETVGVTIYPTPASLSIIGDTAVVCEADDRVYSVAPAAGSHYAWEVPNGASITSGAAGPDNNSITVDFGEDNGYVRVTETSVHGCVGTQVSELISLNGCGLAANFNLSASEICEGNLVTFTDLSTGDIDNWVWSFGSGAVPENAIVQGPHAVNYPNEGVYEVALIVIDGVARDTHTVSVTVSREGVWEGLISSDWFDPDNWSCGLVPTSAMDVEIPAGTTHTPLIDGGAAEVRDITILAGASLTLDTNLLSVHRDWINHGDFQTQGTVVFVGATSIGGNATTTFRDIHVGGASVLTVPSDSMVVQGDMIVNGTLNHNSGTILFTGADEQEVKGSSVIEFYDFVMNKTTHPLLIDHTVEIAANLTLTEGEIQTSPAKLIRFLAGAASDAGNDSAYVDGPVEKVGNTGFVFPTGNNGVWAPIEIAAPSNIAEIFRAQYFHAGHPQAGQDPCTNCGDSLINVPAVEYWDLQRVAGASTPNVTMYFKDMARSGISSVDPLAYAHWNGVEWLEYTLPGSAQLDGNGGCYITGTGLPVTYQVHAPAFNVSPDDCSANISLVAGFELVGQGNNIEMQVDFTGEAPFSISYSDGSDVLTRNNISDNPYTLIHVAEWSGPTAFVDYIFTITEVQDDNGCVTVGEGDAEVRVFKRPSTGNPYVVPNQ